MIGATRMAAAVGVVVVACMGVCALAQPAAPTAGEPGPERAGVFEFEIVDASGHPVPSRLTFLGRDGSRPNLFPNADADPDRLAVRRNVVYTIRGQGAITVPPGRYTVLATRGLEYGLDRTQVEIRPGERSSWRARVEREIDTTGWISADFHLHTLTYSGHGDSNMPERIISIVGEGVEFAVATDHNHNTDYRPTMARVGAESMLSAVTGNEISTGIGHFNAFPLDPESRVIPSRLPSAVPLFKLVREQRNEYGVTPVIQVNHPRWSGINYFGKAGLDPVLGTTSSDLFSADFDTIEIFNENEGFGYFDPDVADVETGSENFSVLRDWFNLLNRGSRYAAVGNSDSHHVEAEMAGFPRNFLPSSTDNPEQIDPAEVASSLRARRVFTTLGPFVEFSVDGEPMGGRVRLPRGRSSVQLAIKVQAASWVDCDVVKVVVNGDIVETIDVPASSDRVRLDTKHTLDVSGDCWVSLLVEGDEPLAPVVHDQTRPIYPIAVLNPVWIDADGDGMWVSPYDRAAERARRASDADGLIRELSGSETMPHERALLAQAASQADHAGTVELVQHLIDDDDRYVRLSAAKAAARLGDERLLPSIRGALERADGDAHLAVSLMRAAIACGDTAAGDRLMEMLTGGDARALDRFSDELSPMLGDNFVRSWLAVGYFESPSAGTVIQREFGPELDPDGSTFGDAKSGPASWTLAHADGRGYVDLLRLEAGSGTPSDAIAYLQTWLISPDDREVGYTLGTDDGCLLWVNGRLVYEDPTRHGAQPLAQVGRISLREGRNRVLLKIENGGGDFGAYFRVLDPEVRSTTDQR